MVKPALRWAPRIKPGRRECTCSRGSASNGARKLCRYSCGLLGVSAFFVAARFLRFPVICLRARELTAPLVLNVAAATVSSARADADFRGLPRPLVRARTANRSMVPIASSICCRSARSSASILRMSMQSSITPARPAAWKFSVHGLRRKGAYLRSRGRPLTSRCLLALSWSAGQECNTGCACRLRPPSWSLPPEFPPLGLPTSPS